VTPRKTLKPILDRLYLEYNRAEAVADPIEIVRPFSSAADREVVGFCAAALAFGRVASVLQSIRHLMAVMGPAPAAFVRTFEPERDGVALDGLVHRWTRGDDLSALLLAIRLMLEEAGSIERFFLSGHDDAAVDISTSLDSFCARALAFDLDAAYARSARGRSARLGPGVAYFFPRTSSGSACKRLNLFLRWMVRKDAIDLGVWSAVRPSQLVVPLDVHVIRLGQCLRLTRYRSPGWRMASDITASLRALDPDDPVRYDFALCHVGMRDQCGFGRPHGDSRCPFKGFCTGGR
jgi:uncharacterized protein (TIGR02757 family)